MSNIPDKFIVSAPGKVILFGEHAVVYGKSAIAGCLDGLRTYIIFEKRLDGYIELNLPDLELGHPLLWPISAFTSMKKYSSKGGNCDDEPLFNEELFQAIKPFVHEGNKRNEDEQKLDHLQQVAASAFLYLFASIEDKRALWSGISIYVSSDLPVGAGLGSSATYSVCLATGLLLVLGHISIPNNSSNQDDEKTDTSAAKLINQWAYQAEKVIHGRPSGIDNSVATYGGAVLYKSGKIEPIKDFHSIRFILTNTKVPRNTLTQVANVRIRHDKFPQIIDPILDAIENISVSLKEILKKLDKIDISEFYEKIGEFIDINHHLANSLGVGHHSLDKICEITADYKLHSKLTGAGGGGCALTLIREDVSDSELSKVIISLESIGYKCYISNVGGPGVGVIDVTNMINLKELLGSKTRPTVGWRYFN
ncbi:4652_t:CDS:10 [Entrophospora sp. SA101]|nr:14755_t:CDS:10 [Entrophospora sp. SA101]CAJ0647695.1 4652_t:CDS:10 [Entrophospora sp. SA101]CAJ0839789.1 2692_t:CDS:10 [Entrophospora sp. SA101]CAJ0842245.1 7225_t:CDS:10 [Entrophospora sp. SA101]